MGTYQFGSGDPANFQTFSSGEYETRIVDNFFSIRALSTGRADLYVSDGSFEPNLSPGESTTALGGQWRLSEGTPSGDASFHGDGDGDGTANALEYVFKDVVIEMKEAGRIRVPQTIPTDVNLALEAENRVALTIGQWARIATWQQGDPINLIFPATTTFTDGFVIDTFDGGGTQFYRFVVTRPEPE